VVLQDCAPLDARVDLPLSTLALGQLRDKEWRDHFLHAGALVLDLAIVFLMLVLLGET
jgi:hypothetical protein